MILARTARGLLLATLLVCSGAFAADGIGSPTVDVKGLVAQPTTFTVADLQKLAAHDVTMKSESRIARTWQGVLLRDLLAACKPIEQGRFDLRQSYFVARATDGYLAVFSWAEIANSDLGDGVLVAYALDGEALAANEGPIALVSARDARSGPRHVRWLASIDVLRATP